MEMILSVLSRLRNKAPFNRKTSFLVDILFFDPASIPITNLAAKVPGLTPNMVTVMSGILGVLAAVMFFYQRVGYGAALMYCSMMLDCVDGNLARKTGQTSDYGAKLDQMMDSLKKVLCLAALTYVSPWNVWLVVGLILVHYGLLRLFPQRYSENYRVETFTSRGLEPLFSPYDLLVILLLLGPLFSFEISLVVVIIIQILASLYARTRTISNPNIDVSTSSQ